MGSQVSRISAKTTCYAPQDTQCSFTDVEDFCSGGRNPDVQQVNNELLPVTHASAKSAVCSSSRTVEIMEIDHSRPHCVQPGFPRGLFSQILLTPNLRFA